MNASFDAWMKKLRDNLVGYRRTSWRRSGRHLRGLNRWPLRRNQGNRRRLHDRFGRKPEGSTLNCPPKPRNHEPRIECGSQGNSDSLSDSTLVENFFRQRIWKTRRYPFSPHKSPAQRKRRGCGTNRTLGAELETCTQRGRRKL